MVNTYKIYNDSDQCNGTNFSDFENTRLVHIFTYLLLSKVTNTYTFILFILSVRYIMVLQFMLQKYVLYKTEIRNEKRVASKRTVYHIALDILKYFHCTLTYVCIIFFAFHIFTCRVTYRLY